jgi:hypothetical protein
VSRTGVCDVVPLILGREDLPRAVPVGSAPAHERLREPVPGELLLCDGGWLLLDTGFDTALLHDPALRRRFRGDPSSRAILPGPGEPLGEAPAHAGIVDEAEQHAIHRIDFDDARRGWRLADGDVDIAPGVTASSPRATPPATRASSSTSTTAWAAGVWCWPSTPPIWRRRTSTRSCRSAGVCTRRPRSASNRSAG